MVYNINYSIFATYLYNMKPNLYYSLILSFLLIVPLTGYCQTTISGKIADKKGMVAGANIFIKDTYDGVSSASDGSFSFVTSEVGSKLLVVSYLGYENYEQQITLNGNPVSITVKLTEKANELNTVTISAGAFEASDEKKMVILRPLDIVTTAGAGGDIYGALQTLPGTQAAGEKEGLYVRGGDASETKTIIDGIMITNPYFSSVPDVPQRGRFSPFLFKGTYFSTGGYSAQYGQAMSSALILESQDLADKTVSGINVMSVGGGLSHTRRWKNSSLGAFVNYTNLRPYFLLLKQKREWDDPPESYGGSLIFRHKTSSTGIIKAFLNYSHNQLALSYPDINDPTESTKKYFNLKNANVFANASFKEVFLKQWSFFAGLAYSYDNNNIFNYGDDLFTHENLAQGRMVISRGIGSLSSIRFGGELQRPFSTNSFNGHLSDYFDIYSAGFIESDIYLTRKLVSRIGTRLEYVESINKFNIAPRLSVAYKTTEKSQVSIAFGDFYQAPDKLNVAMGHQLNFEKATHYILNFQHVDEKRTIRVETYYKQYANLVKYIPDTTNDGKGYARGIDIFWRDKKSLKYADYWISYSFVDTKRHYRDFPVSATPTFVARHTLSIVGKYFFPKISFSVGATYVFASGRPYYNPNKPDEAYLTDLTKSYHNFSMNFAYLTSIMKHFTVIALSVGNVPGISNIFSYRYSDDGLRRQAVGPTSLRSVFAGVFISIGEIRDDDQ